MAEQDPSNAGRPREAAFAESLRIMRRLAEQDPTNTVWQQDLAAALSRIRSIEPAD